MRRIRRKAKELRIGLRHKAVDLFPRLHHLAHMVVQAGGKPHPARQFADLVAARAQLLERRRRIRAGPRARRRKHHQMIRPKSARNFIASRALSSDFCRCAGSSSAPFHEIVTICSPRFVTSCCICACVRPYRVRICGKLVTRTPMKPVSFITSRMLVNGTVGW